MEKTQQDGFWTSRTSAAELVTAYPAAWPFITPGKDYVAFGTSLHDYLLKTETEKKVHRVRMARAAGGLFFCKEEAVVPMHGRIAFHLATPDEIIFAELISEVKNV